MLLGIPLAIWTGVIAFVFILITFNLGLFRKHFKQGGFKYHRLFAVLSVIMLVIHFVLAMALWFYGVLI